MGINPITGVMKLMDNRALRTMAEVIIATVIATVGAISWANSQYVPAEKAEVTHAEILQKSSAGDIEIKKKLDDVERELMKQNELMNDHIDRWKLDNVKNLIRTNRTETFNLEQFIRVNGSDTQSEKRLQSLKSELVELEVKRNCMINRNPLCD